METTGAAKHRAQEPRKVQRRQTYHGRRIHNIINNRGRRCRRGPAKCCGQRHQSRTFLYYTLLSLYVLVGLSCTIYYLVELNKLNYCDRSVSMDGMLGYVRDNVLNQEAALDKLELALSNQMSLQSIALIGSSGVGKTLTMRLLIKQFVWAENVQTIEWNAYLYLIDEDAREDIIWRKLRNLSHCGRNLLVIDNMAISDMYYVANINAMALKHADLTNGSFDPDMKQLTIVYIFNQNKMLPGDYYESHLNMLQELPQTQVITYHSFGPSDLEMCVRREAELLRLNLTERQVQEIVQSTNAQVSGCKTVRPKVIISGQPM